MIQGLKEMIEDFDALNQRMFIPHLFEGPLLFFISFHIVRTMKNPVDPEYMCEANAGTC